MLDPLLVGCPLCLVSEGMACRETRTGKIKKGTHKKRREKAKKNAKHTFDKMVDELVTRIRATEGMTRRVRDTYDNSQGNADVDASPGSEAYDYAQHDHAIVVVANMLAEAGLLEGMDEDGVIDEKIVESAYAKVS